MRVFCSYISSDEDCICLLAIIHVNEVILQTKSSKFYCWCQSRRNIPNEIVVFRDTCRDLPTRNLGIQVTELWEDFPASFMNFQGSSDVSVRSKVLELQTDIFPNGFVLFHVVIPAFRSFFYHNLVKKRLTGLKIDNFALVVRKSESECENPMRDWNVGRTCWMICIANSRYLIEWKIHFFADCSPNVSRAPEATWNRLFDCHVAVRRRISTSNTSAILIGYFSKRIQSFGLDRFSSTSCLHSCARQMNCDRGINVKLISWPVESLSSITWNCVSRSTCANCLESALFGVAPSTKSSKMTEKRVKRNHCSDSAKKRFKYDSKRIGDARIEITRNKPSVHGGKQNKSLHTTYAWKDGIRGKIWTQGSGALVRKKCGDFSNHCNPNQKSMKLFRIPLNPINKYLELVLRNFGSPQRLKLAPQRAHLKESPFVRRIT